MKKFESILCLDLSFSVLGNYCTLGNHHDPSLTSCRGSQIQQGETSLLISSCVLPFAQLVFLSLRILEHPKRIVNQQHFPLSCHKLESYHTVMSHDSMESDVMTHDILTDLQYVSTSQTEYIVLR